jgi:signal transduction histidine kinase
MNALPVKIEYLFNHMPYAVEIYDKDGNLVEVNKSWRELFQYTREKIPEINVLENKLIRKAGIIDKLKKIFSDGGRLKSVPVLYEKGDLNFTAVRKEIMLKFYFYSLHNNDESILYVINLIEDVTDEIKQSEIQKELEIQRRNAKIILEILEDERKRVAQDLHDVIGQKILLAKLNIELFQKKHLEKFAELDESVKHLIDLSKEIKSVIHSLHPIVIEKYGIIDSLDLLVHEFNLSSGYEAVLKYFGNPEYDNINIDLNIYRIIQESLNNIAKHSRAKTVEIEVHFTSKMVICSVMDDGIGFNYNEFSSHGSKKYHYGLISMKERAKLFGGELQVDTQIGKGTKIVFQIPTGKVAK